MRPVPAGLVFNHRWRQQLHRSLPRGVFLGGRGNLLHALPAPHLLCQRGRLLLRARDLPCTGRRGLLRLPRGPLLRLPGHFLRRLRRGHVQPQPGRHRCRRLRGLLCAARLRVRVWLPRRVRVALPRGLLVRGGGRRPRALHLAASRLRVRRGRRRGRAIALPQRLLLQRRRRAAAAVRLPRELRRAGGRR